MVSARACRVSGTSSVGKSAQGFTLIELLVVLAILTLLAGLVGPRVLNQLGGAKSKTAGVQIADLDKSLELFQLDVGRYPTTQEGLDALVKRQAVSMAGRALPKVVCLPILGVIHISTPTLDQTAALRSFLLGRMAAGGEG